MNNELMQGVEFSHFLLKKNIKPGDRVIDATAGNGYDTIFLSKLVGEKGRVFAFDIQSRAINITRERLKQNNLLSQVDLHLDSHENLDKYIDESVKAILFNLGYLPGGNKNIITRPQVTLNALQKGLKLLTNGGLIVLVIYVGHKGGQEEKEELITYISKLPDHKYNVLHYHFLNQQSPPAEVLAIKKRN